LNDFLPLPKEVYSLPATAGSFSALKDILARTKQFHAKNSSSQTQKKLLYIMLNSYSLCRWNACPDIGFTL